MRINYSLSLKLTLIIVLVSTLVIVSLAYFFIKEEEDLFEEKYLDNYFDKAESLVKALNASIASYYGMNDTELLQNHIENFTKSDSDILKINIKKYTNF